jgi:hypothetical protein
MMMMMMMMMPIKLSDWLCPPYVHPELVVEKTKKAQFSRRKTNETKPPAQYAMMMMMPIKLSRDVALRILRIPRIKKVFDVPSNCGNLPMPTA